MEAVMRIRLLFALLTLSVFHVFAASVYAQASLKDIKIEACGTEDVLKGLIANEEKRGLVIDARPFAINQSTGKIAFEGKTGRVSVVHMNPFIYKYEISVTQQELKSSAVTDFIEILLPPGLRIGAPAKAANEKHEAITRMVQKTAASSPIARRLDRFNTADCHNPNDDICVALKTMNAEYLLIKNALAAASLETQLTPPAAFQTFKSNLTNLRDEATNAVKTCEHAKTLYTSLTNDKPADILDTLNGVGEVIKEITLNANDLANLADKYSEDDGLKDYVVRCGGFNCVAEFKDYAESVVALLELHSTDLAGLTAVAEAMKRAFDLTDQMRKKDGVFARSFDVEKKFEMSAATISVTRTKLDSKPEPPAKNAR